LILWETYHISKTDEKEDHNLSIYETQTGNLFKSFVQKKQLENFVEWTNDEEMFAFLAANNEILFYEKKDPKTIKNRIRMENLCQFIMSSVSKCVAVHVSGKKSEPTFIRLLQYPNLNNVLTNKSFFNADRIDFKWNKSGTNLLLLCSTETSANSYYGDSTLHQVKLDGESQTVQLSKKGPIYALEWNPCRDEFVVVYGTMPANATQFNAKCDALYEFGTGSRNECFFNPHGNLLCLAGFGNLRGRVEIWNLIGANKVPQEVSSFQVDDTTYFQWSPDGEHILTATTAPRLRVSNGFKIWHYSGENKFTYQMPANCPELWQVLWQPGVYEQKPVFKKDTVAAVKEETKAYVPPHLRGSNNVASFKTKLHEDDEKPDKNLKAKSHQTGVEDTEKKIKNLKKKLTQIEDLKKRQSQGEQLEKNQLDKLHSKDELLSELEKISL
jgi:translation initiation factor 2A